MKGYCPDCGSEDIQTLEYVIATQYVLDWEEDGDGNLIPFDYGEASTWYEATEPVYKGEPYECMTCSEHFAHPVKEPKEETNGSANTEGAQASPGADQPERSTQSSAHGSGVPGGREGSH